MNARTHTPARRATATVEMAVILPLLGLLVMGMVEVTRAVQVRHYLTDATRSGGRLAILPGSSNAQVTGAMNQALTSFGLDPAYATPAILVNGAPADVSGAKQGDQISVRIGVPVGRVSWVAPAIFTNSSIESETLVLMRQQ